MESQTLRPDFSVSVLRTAVALLCAALAIPSVVIAQGVSSGKGKIQIESASITDTTSGLVLSAFATIDLSREIRSGLDSGVPLEFIIDVRIKRRRPFWIDETLFAQTRRYSLNYYELTRHYRLREMQTMESYNFRSLYPALEALGDLRNIALGSAAEFDSSSSLTGHVAIRLDGRALPLPLQPWISSTWRLASEDYTWPLN